MFESRSSPSTDPLVLWMTGGPGCSSELAIFFEQGPYRVDNDLNVTINPYAWNSNANVIFVDQPVGTGFSTADHAEDYVRNEDQVAEDMYEFLQTFFESFPQYKGLDFFVTGESYAGHYVPSVSYRIFKANQKSEGPYDIPLTGLAIGNGLVYPLLQYEDYAPYAHDNEMITDEEYKTLAEYYVPQCIQAIKDDSPLASSQCNSILGRIQNWAGNFNVYDIRKPCHGPLCYDFSALDRLMLQEEVQTSLGVHPDANWAECDGKVHEYLADDWMLNCEQYIPEMLESGIRVLVYAGKEDFICNWYGNQHWVRSMPWKHQKDFNKQEVSPWKVNGVTAGEVQAYGDLTFLAIEDAGHMVPMDVPEAALDMLSRFMAKESFVETIELSEY